MSDAADRAWREWERQRLADEERIADDERRQRSAEIRRERKPWHPTEAECRHMSQEELERRWGGAIRAAARAAFPQSGALGRAAYLGGVITVAGRLSEDRVQEHLRRAARAAGVFPDEADRVIDNQYLMGQAHALGELARGGAVDGHPPGAFAAIASATDIYDSGIAMSVDPTALVPLPVATLVHWGHDFDSDPVAVAVPRMRGKVIEVDAVFGSAAGAAWTLTRTGRLPAVSIYARATEFFRGVSGRMVSGVLTSVDLCEAGVDEQARVTAVVPATDLTPGQREVQRRFDEYLDNESPIAFDILSRVNRQGAAALDVLSDVVAPLRAELARSSTVRATVS